MPMFSPRVLLLAALLLICGIAHAQTTAQQVTPGVLAPSGCASTALTPCFLPPVGMLTQTTVTCGTGSTLLLAAGAATTFIVVKVPAAATVPVWLDWSGNAAVAAPPSEDLAAGTLRVWSALGGFLPTAALHCLATSATAVTVEYR